MNFVQQHISTLKTKKAKRAFFKEHTGGLSEPSKMPGYGYSTPAKRCKTGSKLRTIKGSTCSSCYAMKGRYTFALTQQALERRYFLSQDRYWHLYMVEYLRMEYEGNKDKYFRWFDSGDLQDIEQLRKIVYIAEQLPDIKFWLPTREIQIVKAYKLEHGDFPRNLIVRISNHMIDQDHRPNWHKYSSGVTTDPNNKHICPAHKQHNMCGECRACWDGRVRHVNYLKH